MTRDELVTVEVICHLGKHAVLALEDFLDEPIGFDDDTPERQVELAAGVQFILDNPAAPLSAQHEAWKERNRHRLTADDPRLVAFDEMPFGMQLKARLWRHIVHAVVG